MTRRKRAGENFDSLYLLLDTVCNTFGLFIFISINVAILVGTRNTQSVVEGLMQQAEASDPLAGERAAIKRLRVMVTDAERKTSTETETAVASGKLASLRQSNERSARKVEELSSILKVGGERTEALKVELPQLRKEIDLLESELKSEASSLDKKVRTPRRREVEGLLPVQVILWRDRVYWINPWRGSIDEPCARWSEWNPNAVDLAARPESVIHECFRGGGQWIERHVPLRVDGGLEVGLEGETSWEQPLSDLLDRLATTKHVVSLKVAPDSHRAFGQVRNLIAEKGFAYDVSPIQLGDGVYRDEIRDGVATAQ
ncbi:MAG: hypothetical protein K8R92_09715 [Planctomycetes bacterium]|nr:hypothetical protein [Planctomycetota bacterium]